MSILRDQSPIVPVAEVDGQRGDLIGLAFDTLADPMSAPVLYLLVRILDSKLRQYGLPHGQVGGFYRPSFCVLIVAVPNWRKALPLVLEFERDYAGFAKSQIAYWCKAEQFWRTLAGGPEPFDRFLTQAHLDGATAEVKARSQEIERLLPHRKENP